VRQKLHVPVDKTVVSWVGNAMPYKGLHTVAELVRQVPEVHFLLVCRGGIPPDVAAYPNVTLMENVPYAELHEVYQASDASLTPYRIGPFCFAMAEAMSTALPIICSPGVSVPEFLRKGPLEQLVVSDQGDVAGFLRALRALLANKETMRRAALDLREELRAIMDAPRWRAQMFELLDGEGERRSRRNAS